MPDDAEYLSLDDVIRSMSVDDPTSAARAALVGLEPAPGRAQVLAGPAGHTPADRGWTDIGYLVNDGIVGFDGAGGEPVVVTAAIDPATGQIGRLTVVPSTATGHYTVIDEHYRFTPSPAQRADLINRWAGDGARYARGGPIPAAAAASADRPPVVRLRSRHSTSGGPATAGTVPPADAAADGGVAGLLDRIDDVVADRCACGCSLILDPDGPSGFFATPDCQRRWHARQATRPHEVETRPDAAPVYVGQDAAAVPLYGEPGPVPDHWTDLGYTSDTAGTFEREHDDQDRGHQHRHAARSDAAIALDLAFTAARHLREARIAPCPNPHGVAYRRWCQPCAADVIPRPVMYRAVDPPDGDSIRLVCPDCGTRIMGPAYLADAAETEPGLLLLELTDGTARSRRRITIDDLTRRTDPDRTVRRMWAVMERELANFHVRWHSPTGPHPAGQEEEAPRLDMTPAEVGRLFLNRPIRGD